MVKTDFFKNGVTVFVEKSLQSTSYDGVLVVTYPKDVNVRAPSPLQTVIDKALELDRGLETELSVLNCPGIAGSRLIVSPTGPISPYDDVRSVYEAAQRGINRAIKAGIKNPIVILQNVPKFKQNALVLLLGVFESLYVPIQVRENAPQKKSGIDKIGVYGDNMSDNLNTVIENALALEHGRIIARDVAGGDPERMCPPNVETYVKEQFKDDANITIEVISDLKLIEKEFPLFAAVNRAANEIERHKGRIIFLTYNPNSTQVKDTMILVGKGVTYDTGGADIKAGGHMAGMSRDKSGAAAVAGFLKTCALLKPQHVKVIGIMSMVRNSVGENCYVSDELLVSRSGKLVRIGNTDAEGRMVMADVVCMMKDRAKTEINPHIYTIATLTGHAIKAFGEGYAAVVDNHVARDQNHGRKLQESGEIMADMFEVSSMRREDLATHRGTFRGDDVLQSKCEPSVLLERGHQGPAAFILIASGLEGENIKFSHIDMAPSAGIAPKEPTASPMLALAHLYQILK